MSTELLFSDYPQKVLLSTSRREQYYTWNVAKGFLAGKKKLPPARLYFLSTPGKCGLRDLDRSKVVPIAWHKGTNKKVPISPALIDDVDLQNFIKHSGFFTEKQQAVVIVVLADKELNPILANPKAANTAKYITINGQYMYQGANPFVRTKIVDTLREYFNKELDKQAVEKLVIPSTRLKITYTFYNLVGVGNWDLDNHSAFYCKVLQDVLRDRLLGGDDSIYRIPSKEIRFRPLENPEEVKPYMWVEIDSDTQTIW